MTGENHKTTTKGLTSPPPANISEFNTITGLVFAELYKHFPVAMHLDRAAIEFAIAVSSPRRPLFCNQADHSPRYLPTA